MPESIAVELEPAGLPAYRILEPERKFPPNYSGRLWTAPEKKGQKLVIY